MKKGFKKNLKLSLAFILSSLIISLNNKTSPGFDFKSDIFNKPKPNINTDIKNECIEILTKTTKEILNKENFIIPTLSEEEKLNLLSFYNYFFLTDLCIEELKDHFKNIKYTKSLSEDVLDKNRLNIIIFTKGYSYRGLSTNIKTTFETIKNNHLENKICQNAKTLKELTLCLKNEKIILHEQRGYPKTFNHIIYPLSILYPDKINLIWLKINYNKEERKINNFIKQLEKKEINYNVCLIHDETDTYLKALSIQSDITIYCPNFNLEKKFSIYDKKFPIINIYTLLMIERKNQPVYPALYIVDFNQYINDNSNDNIINSFIKLRHNILNTEHNLIEKQKENFFKNKYLTLALSKNTYNRLQIDLSYNPEIYDEFIEKLLLQTIVPYELLKWLKKEMIPRKVL